MVAVAVSNESNGRAAWIELILGSPLRRSQINLNEVPDRTTRCQQFIKAVNL